jgi:glycosyltransferase involved in cell wall biosynthesis
MKILFINIAYPKEIYQQLKEDAKGILQVPCDVFQWAVIDGLEQYGIDYTLATVPALPAWPRYKQLYTPKGEMMVNGKSRGHYLSYCDAPAVKQLTQRRVLRKYVRQWCDANRNEDCLGVLTYTQHVEILGAAIDLKNDYPNLIVAPIVTDLIEDALDFASNRTFLKRLQVKMEALEEQKLFPKVDKFVLLTRQMTERIPEAKGKYIVVEGISPKKEEKLQFIVKSGQPRTLLYTGVLEEYAGIRLLVDAFMNVKRTDISLVICGSGSDESYVRKMMSTDHRIDFRGRVDRDEAVKLQRESTLLINPRQPNGGITKYSFPSKTMEYMTSGTPMIGYHLEGIPEEYYEYMYSPCDVSKESLTKCIYNTLLLSDEDLNEKAKKAYEFVTQKKNSKEQVKRIINFMIN